MENRINLNVGNKVFELSLRDLTVFDSIFLNTLIDPDTNFRKPENDQYFVHDADPIYFEAFLTTMRSGIPPSILLSINEKGDNEKEEFMWQEADFWGIQDKIKRHIKIEAQSAARVIQRAFYLYKACKPYTSVGYTNDLIVSTSKVVNCCVCGVRWSSADKCEVSHCPFKDCFFRLHGNGAMGGTLYNWNFYVCHPCGRLRRPDLAGGTHYCSHNRECFTACFKCKGTCDRSGWCPLEPLDESYCIK